ncbi:MAG: S-layer homology domain-containing protein [Candidatus Rifleibacteriota bacterium]
MKLKSLALSAALLMAPAIAGASQFSDVPVSHWAYDAIHQLAGKGVLQGYPDGTFKGNKALTRFDLSMATAKMLASVEQMLESGAGNLVTKADLQTLEKLTVEFADELALLGVKVTSIEDDMVVAKEDVAMLKRDVEGIKDYMAKGGMEKVKLSGDMLVRHTSITHKNDWAAGAFGGARAGNTDNALTESLIGLTFTSHIDENITGTCYVALLDYHVTGVNAGQSPFQSAFGVGGIGAQKFADMTVYIANLEVKDMFRFGGDFNFGRNLYFQGHGLLIDNYLDMIRYTKPVGKVNVTANHFFDRHVGNYKDNAAVDSRGVWNLQLDTNYKKHDMYLGFYAQDEVNLMARGRMAPLFAAPTAPFMLTAGAVANSVAPLAPGVQSSDNRWDIEFGSKGPIGKNSHWEYDLSFVYTDYQLDVVNDATTAANPWISPEMNGWMGHAAVRWDSKKEWAAKLAYSFADDESIGAVSTFNDMRYQSAAETPFEDLNKGNNWFNNGLTNMYDLKLQVEYKPENSKHYFRLAGDFIDEMQDAPVNDLSRHSAGHGLTNAAIIPAGGSKNNTAYDSWNNIGIADPRATMVTFEYRYQLTENTRIRVGYTNFDLTGDAQKAGWTAGAVTATPEISAGRGLNNDYDYNMFWTEIYSLF